MNKSEIFDKITTQLKAKLEKGTLPWRRSWKLGIPVNFITRRPYNGINFLSLSLNDYPSPYYLTFLQCKGKEGSIAKGAKGSLVIYWKIRELIDNAKDEARDKIRLVPFTCHSYVFNLSETSLYKGSDFVNEITTCEDIMEGMTLKPVVRHNISKCYYAPEEDYISLPKIEDFDSPEEYYSSFFHELIHWTGHPGRLNRFQNIDESDSYSFEELVAEIGSAYLCGLACVSPKILDNQAGYINSWLHKLNDDKNFFIKASMKSQEAVNYILQGRGRIDKSN